MGRASPVSGFGAGYVPAALSAIAGNSAPHWLARRPSAAGPSDACFGSLEGGGKFVVVFYQNGFAG
jgi:hypothetical protein